MNFEKKYLIIILCFSLKIKSQGVHFSQFNEQPALVNPALTGSSGSIRASVGYKDQWRTVTNSYKTLGLSYEMRFNQSSWLEGNKLISKNAKKKSMGRLAGGLSVYNDNAGDGKMDATIVNLSLASFVSLSKQSALSLGIQGGLVQNRFNGDKLIFPNQFSGSTYNENLPSGENFSSQNNTYADFSVGMLWSYTKPDKKIEGHKSIKINFGFSFYHINKPEQKFLVSSKDALYIKYVFHGDFLYCIPNSNLALAPTYLFQLQGSSKEIITGIIMKYYLDNDSKYTGISKRSCLNYGAYYRNNDAVIINLIYEHHEKYAIGLSYDLNLSQLASASKARGGVEIILRYTPSIIIKGDQKKQN